MTAPTIEPRNAEYWWSKLTRTQQRVLIAGAALGGRIPFAAQVDTIRVLIRLGYIRDGRLTENAMRLAYLGPRSVKAVTA